MFYVILLLNNLYILLTSCSSCKSVAWFKNFQIRSWYALFLSLSRSLPPLHTIFHTLIRCFIFFCAGECRCENKKPNKTADKNKRKEKRWRRRHSNAICNFNFCRSCFAVFVHIIKVVKMNCHTAKKREKSKLQIVNCFCHKGGNASLNNKKTRIQIVQQKTKNK